jgi:hypothetical protein
MKIIQSQRRRMKMNRQVGGSHYEVLRIQPVELFCEFSLNWFQAEPLKYVSRFKNKNGYQDLEKAKHILGIAMEHRPEIFSRVDNYNVELIEKYLDQFREGYFHEPLSMDFMVDFVYHIIYGKYRDAYVDLNHLIYAEYEIDEQ